VNLEFPLDAVKGELVKVVDKFAEKQGAWDVPVIFMLPTSSFGDAEVRLGSIKVF
jgi:hypothetical protein